MNMKIGIISPYSSQNYGTVLQAFALAHVLESKGAECEYINYRTWKRGDKVDYIKFLLRHPLYLLSKRWTQHVNRHDLKYSHVRDSWFSEVIRKNEEFVSKYIPNSTELFTYDTLSNLRAQYNKIIVGSDQTWSPFHELIYSMFFLDLYKYGKSYSYAPSLGTTKPCKTFLKYLSGKVNRLSLASCREVCNSRVLTEMSNKDVTCVLDPTLLIDRNGWKPYFEPVEGMPDKYILCYILGERADISELAENMGKEMNLPVYYISTRDIYRSKVNHLDSVGVGNFLWLIDNASWVITDSFHSTIFSINFNRNFYCFDKMPGDRYDNGRLQDMLMQVGLEDRLLKTTIDSYSIVDYKEMNSILNKRREESMIFIDQIICD